MSDKGDDDQNPETDTSSASASALAKEVEEQISKEEYDTEQKKMVLDIFRTNKKSKDPLNFSYGGEGGRGGGAEVETDTDADDATQSEQKLDTDQEANLLETIVTKNIEKANSTTIQLLETGGALGGTFNLEDIAWNVASKVLNAFLKFKEPVAKRREYLIPKDKAAWLEWLVSVATRRITVEYLSDKELRKVVIRARPNLAPFKPKFNGPVEDPDLPECIWWNEEQVGDWIASMGWPALRETFMRNRITGRRLVLVDCSALVKMGMNDLTAMKDVAGKIRDLLGIPPPNGMRAIMRVSPFERFLRRKVYSGRSYDEVSFQKFCEMEGYNYEYLQSNKNAQIPCTTEVLITTPENAEDDADEKFDEDEEYSLKNAPTVEYLVRNALVRNKLIDELMEDILTNLFLPPRERKYGKELWGSLKRGIGEGFDDLYLYYPKERLDFASGVAHSLIDELYKTVAIMNDINQLQRHIKENISEDEVQVFKGCAEALVEQVVPIAALLALGELDMECIFKQEPEFEKFVDAVIRRAERKTNELVPDAGHFVDEVLNSALKKIGKMDLSQMQPDLKESLMRMTSGMTQKIQTHNQNVEKAARARSKSVAQAQIQQQEPVKPVKSGNPRKEGGGGAKHAQHNKHRKSAPAPAAQHAKENEG